MNIYVGNLSLETTEQELRKAFEAHGRVAAVAIPMQATTSGRTGASSGYGFVRMNDPVAARSAIRALHRTDLRGQALSLQEARSHRLFSGLHR